jgi:hypothetical protein
MTRWKLAEAVPVPFFSVDMKRIEKEIQSRASLWPYLPSVNRQTWLVYQEWESVLKNARASCLEMWQFFPWRMVARYGQVMNSLRAVPRPAVYQVSSLKSARQVSPAL